MESVVKGDSVSAVNLVNEKNSSLKKAQVGIAVFCILFRKKRKLRFFTEISLRSSELVYLWYQVYSVSVVKRLLPLFGLLHQAKK